MLFLQALAEFGGEHLPIGASIGDEDAWGAIWGVSACGHCESFPSVVFRDANTCAVLYFTLSKDAAKDQDGVDVESHTLESQSMS